MALLRRRALSSHCASSDWSRKNGVSRPSFSASRKRSRASNSSRRCVSVWAPSWSSEYSVGEDRLRRGVIGVRGREGLDLGAPLGALELQRLRERHGAGRTLAHQLGIDLAGAGAPVLHAQEGGVAQMRIDIVEAERRERPVGAARRERIAARFVEPRVVVELRRGLRVGNDPALSGKRRERLRRIGRRWRRRLDRRGIGLRRFLCRLRRLRWDLRLLDRRRRARRRRPQGEERDPRRDERPGAAEDRKRRAAPLSASRPAPPPVLRVQLRVQPRPGDHEGVDAVRDVLDLALADVAERHRHLVRHRLVHRARDADAAGLGEALEPGRDVDAVAEEIAAALDDVADGDADAEFEPPPRRQRAIAGPEQFLDVDRAAHRVDGRIELAHHRVAGGVEDAAAGAADEIVEHLAIAAEPGQRLLFGLGDEARIAGDVRGEDRRDLALHRARAPVHHGSRR